MALCCRNVVVDGSGKAIYDLKIRAGFLALKLNLFSNLSHLEHPRPCYPSLC